jgi:hypothetical protein
MKATWVYEMPIRGQMPFSDTPIDTSLLRPPHT